MNITGRERVGVLGCGQCVLTCKQSEEAPLPTAEWLRGTGQGPDCGAHVRDSKPVIN